MANNQSDQNLKNLEEYLAGLQEIEIGINEARNPINKIQRRHTTNESFYASILSAGESMKQIELQRELEEWLERLTKKSGTKGRLMSKRAMDLFLERSERRDITQKQLAALNQLNDRQIERRIMLYRKQIEKEVTLLGNEIEEFFLNAKTAGLSKKETLSQLIKASRDDKGLAAGFEKRMKRISINAARREAQDQAVEEYRKIAKPGESWQWIAISTNPCPDCTARAGVVLPYSIWKKKGLPGSGSTICRSACKCQLVPVSVSDELFPDAKSYKWDKESLVLTTAQDARTFGAKSNQGSKLKKVKNPNAKK